MASEKTVEFTLKAKDNAAKKFKAALADADVFFFFFLRPRSVTYC